MLSFGTTRRAVAPPCLSTRIRSDRHFPDLAGACARAGGGGGGACPSDEKAKRNFSHTESTHSSGVHGVHCGSFTVGNCTWHSHVQYLHTPVDNSSTANYFTRW